MRNLILPAALLVTLLGGCAYGPHGGEIGETGYSRVVNQTDLPAPNEQDIAGTARAYVIGPQDELVIDVYGIEDLMKREVVVDAAGRISFPIAGTVVAAGLTPEQLASTLQAGLEAGFVRNPQVTVNVKEAVSQTVTVDGQVMRPGNYRVLPDMTLLRAVASARGLSEFAKMDDVVILRSVGGQRYAGLYNISAIRRGNYKDPVIYANDVVVVGDSTERRMFKDFLTLLPALTSPLIYLLDSNN